MKLGFVLCHGWALTPDFLTPLRAALIARFPEARMHALDLGYYGAPQLVLPDAADTYWIGIGHSYGFVRLLRLPLAWHRLVSIAGFTHFDAPDAIPQTLLARLQHDPAASLRHFYRLCGLPGAWRPQGVRDDARLESDLRDLITCDEGARLPPNGVLALASANDAIVSRALTQKCFASCSLRWHSSAGHALGALDAEWCATSIETFIKTC